MARILVVDDEAAIRSFYRMVLEPAGHEILEAADGVEGLAKVQQGHFDLVITELNIPNMKGDVMAKEIKIQRRDLDLRILLISSETSTSGAIDSMLEKPVAPDRIRAEVEFLLK